MKAHIRIGTRESELATWQAMLVKQGLGEKGYPSTLVYIKSEGDADLQTPLYEMGVQGIFTRSLDIALLNNVIDIAVHSMKDVPTQLPAGIAQAAVLKRGNHRDLFVLNPHSEMPDRKSLHTLIDSLQTNGYRLPVDNLQFTIATSSIRRKAQWLHRYPKAIVENLRGNVNTRLQKLGSSRWHGAIFAAAGLERINLRPENSIELDWMLPAPAQGAIMIACRTNDDVTAAAAAKLNDNATAICTRIERDFLRALLGGCSTPISALAKLHGKEIHFTGNIFSTDGKHKAVIEKALAAEHAGKIGEKMAVELLKNGGQAIADSIRDAK